MYEGLTHEVRQTIDDAFKSLTDDLKALNYGCGMCDPAEMLIDQMTEYFLCSNPSFRAVTYAAAAHFEATGEYTKGCGP